MRADHKDRREAGGRAGKGKPLCGGRTGSRLSVGAELQATSRLPGPGQRKWGAGSEGRSGWGMVRVGAGGATAVRSQRQRLK